VTFTFAVAKFSGARLRRVTPPENFPLRLRLSTLTGSSKVGRDAGFEFPTQMKKKRIVEIFTTAPLPLRAVMRGDHWRRSLMAGWQANLFPRNRWPGRSY
jgi:hypothetical protein